MKSSNVAFFSFWVFVGILALFFLANKMINEGQIPPLQQYMTDNVATTSIKLPVTMINIASSSLLAFVADDEPTREKGLGGVTSLSDKEGMLFVFPTSTVPSFWMKDTLIPLDIVWIDQGKKVVGVTEGIATSTYPKTFSPMSPVLYVLEINSGSARKNKIVAGTKLQFDLFK